MTSVMTFARVLAGVAIGVGFLAASPASATTKTVYKSMAAGSAYYSWETECFDHLESWARIHAEPECYENAEQYKWWTVDVESPLTQFEMGSVLISVFGKSNHPPPDDDAEICTAAVLQSDGS